MGNGETVTWEVRVGSQVIGEVLGGLECDLELARKAEVVASECGIAASMFHRWGSVSDGMGRRPVGPILKNA